MKNKWTLVIVGLLLLVLVRQFQIDGEVSQLQQTLYNISSQIQMVDNKMESTLSQIKEMSDGERLVQSLTHEYAPINEAGLSGTTVTVRAAFNEIGLDDQVWLQYRPISGGTWTDLALESDSDGSYTGVFDATFEEDLETRIVVVSDQTRALESTDPIRLRTQSLPPYDMECRAEKISSDGQVTYSAHLEYFSKGGPVQLTEATVRVLYEGQLIEEEPLMSEDYLMLDEGEFKVWRLDKTITYLPPGSSEVDVDGFEFRITAVDTLGRVFNDGMIK